MSEVLSSSPEDDTYEIRPARPGEAPVLAGLHAEIRTGFLPRLGSRFLTRLYRALIAWPGADVLVADDGAGPIGFVASTEDTGLFYKHFLKRHGIPAGFALLPKLIRPSIVKRIWETFRYGTDIQAVEVEAELFAIATSTESRGRGLGSLLLEAAVDRYRERGLDRVQVVVSSNNPASLAAHRKVGFVDAGTVEVHAGEPSTVLVWSAI
jgi:ribosomal protein S18 acetylase RimI-like enzyme